MGTIVAQMTLRKAMEDAEHEARRTGHVQYVYKTESGEIMIVQRYWHDWLFRAHPGGRKHLSVAGERELKEEE